MDIRVREHTISVQIIALDGRLDVFSVSALRDTRDRLLNAGHCYFVVDLQALTFMDSAGLAALVSLLKRARQVGGEVVLVKPTDPAAYRTLSLTRFDHVFALRDSVEQALSYFMPHLDGSADQRNG